jgi:polar amino acid transport system substrate-binding protein
MYLINNFRSDQVVVNNNGKRFAIESDPLYINFQKKRNMKRLVLFFLCCCIGAVDIFGSEIIVFNTSPKGYPPYMIKEAGKQSSGIMVEILQIIASKHGYVVKTKGVPRKRVDNQLKTGGLDATARAKEWVPNPENYEFTDVIVRASDVLFSLEKTPITFQKIEDLFGKRIGAHLGYKYPMLDIYFKDNRISRNDTANETAMLTMVLKERTDAAVINELVGKWLIRQKHWQGKFVVSEKEIGGFDYRIMFNKKWRSFVQKFNQELTLMKQNGELERIISKYK